MPILTIQRQFRELGRIRAGDQQEYVKDGVKKHRPVKGTTFRLTSASQNLVERVAAEYGGKVQPWANAPEGSGPQYECTITAAALDVLVPPGQVYSQYMELWKGGGCLRRCDGITELLTNTPCLCPADPKERTALAAKGEACKPTTRLNVMLPRIPDIGVWRLETHSYYAAVELAGTADVLRKATEAGYPLPAQLRIDQRHVKRPNEPRKDFPVVVLELPDSLPGVLLARPADLPGIGPGPAAPLLTAGGRPDIPHAPEPHGAPETKPVGVATVSALTSGRDDGSAAPVVTDDGKAVGADGVIEDGLVDEDLFAEADLGAAGADLIEYARERAAEEPAGLSREEFVRRLATISKTLENVDRKAVARITGKKDPKPSQLLPADWLALAVEMGLA